MESPSMLPMRCEDIRLIYEGRYLSNVLSYKIKVSSELLFSIIEIEKYDSNLEKVIKLRGNIFSLSSVLHNVHNKKLPSYTTVTITVVGLVRMDEESEELYKDN